MTAKAKTLVVHGGGGGSNDYNKQLANVVRGQFDDQTQVAYPKFKGLEQLDQFDWNLTRKELDGALEKLTDDGQVICHSLGGAAMLKLLSEHGKTRRIKGLFLLAMPYIFMDGEWATDNFAIDNDFAAQLPDCGDILLYHSQTLI